MASSLRHLAVEAAAGTVAAIGGIALFVLVFAWPTLVPGKQDLMLAWGWVGWIPGGLAGYYVGGVLRRLTRMVFGTEASSTAGRVPNNVQSMRIHRLLAVGCALVALCFLVMIVPLGISGLRIAGPTILLTLAIAVVNAVVAFGAARSASWARICSMVIGGLLLIAFPIGTLVGVYLLGNLKWQEGKDA